MANFYTKDPEPRELTTPTYQTTVTSDCCRNFEIQGFSYIKDMEVGKYITSEPFSVGGLLWEIQFFPNGDDADDASIDKYVSIFVKLVSKCKKDLLVWLAHEDSRDRISAVKMEEMNKQYMDGPYTIYEGCRSSTLVSYNRTYFESLIKDDCFTFRCSIVVTVENDEARPMPLSDLKQSYEELLKSREGSDISFEVDGEIFYAHKLILSTRSPVFKAQFFGLLKDNNTQCIKIEEMRAPVFKALLHFIYCDVIPKPDSDCKGTIMIQHLLAAADRYGIPTLKSLCESRLCEHFSIDTVASTLALAEQHGFYQLKTWCLEFIELPENLQAVMQTDGFEKLNESYPAIIFELLKYVARNRSSCSCDAKEKCANLRK